MKNFVFAVWRFLAGLERPSRNANARRLHERGEDVDSLVIRQATADGIPALTRLHVKTWNATYAPLLIKGPSEKIRETQGVGLGRRLIGLVAQRFLSEGVESMWLFGDARNPSNKVWMALGAVKTDDDPGTGNYGWRDLRTLVGQAEK